MVVVSVLPGLHRNAQYWAKVSSAPSSTCTEPPGAAETEGTTVLCLLAALPLASLWEA